MGINSHYEISQNNLAPCGIICIFTQDRGNDSVCGCIIIIFSFRRRWLFFVAYRVIVCGVTVINFWGAYGLRAWGGDTKTF